MLLLVTIKWECKQTSVQSHILHTSCFKSVLMAQQLTTGRFKLVVWLFLSSDSEFESEQNTEQNPAAPVGSGQHIFRTGGPATVVGLRNEGRCFTAALHLIRPLGLLQSCHSCRESLLPKAQVLLGDGLKPLLEGGAAEKALSKKHLARKSSSTISTLQQSKKWRWSLERRLNTDKSLG